MSATPIRRYVFTPHAFFELDRRGLSEQLVDSVLENPGQRSEVRPGRDVLQSKVQI